MRVLGCLLFVAFAAWVAVVGYSSEPWPMLRSAALAGCGAYFAFVAAAYVAGLFDGIGLSADKTGFSYRFLWQRRRFSWDEVSEFRSANYRLLHVIAFDRHDAPDTSRTRTNRRLIGVSDFIIAHNFSAPLTEVCHTMNELRNRALGAA